MFTGIPCITCGATRGAQALLHGDWMEAALWNPLTFLGILIIFIGVAYAVLVVVFRLPRMRVSGVTSQQARLLRIVIIVALAGNWLYVILARRV